MIKNENDLENACCDYARQAGLVAVKLENVGMEGIPDRMFIREGGKTFFVEFKSPTKKGRLSPKQKFWLKFLGASGFVCDDFQSFKDIVKKNNPSGGDF